MDWNLIDWLPLEPGVDHHRSKNGLDKATWASTFACRKFKTLMKSIMQSPADIIMSLLKLLANNDFAGVGSRLVSLVSLRHTLSANV